MKIEHLALDCRDSRTPSKALKLAAGLNVVSARAPLSSRQIADLVGHVLYGARLYRQEDVVYDHPGHVDVASSLGRFRLERHVERAHRGTFTEPRLTVAPLNGQQARAGTARELLSGMTPEVASRLMVLGATDDAQLNWLLSTELATELCRLERIVSNADRPQESSVGGGELFARRDRLSQQIETLLAEKRQASKALEVALAELALETNARERRLNDDRRELEGLHSQLAELDTQLRYHELAEFVGRTSDEAYHSEQQPTLAGLDDEIAKWRRTLAELESREAHVRSQLAQLHPDDSSPTLPLADQRAAVTIAQRLVADLDSEVARYARPSDSRACLCQHTHARLHPLVDTLGQQVEKLARLVEQYEAAVDGEQLKAEAQHLARSQAELRATIDHLLDRRQSRLRTSRGREVNDRTEKLPADWQQLHAELQRLRSQRQAAVDQGQQELEKLTSRRDQMHRQRAELMNDTALASLRQQLDQVTRQLDPGHATPPRATFSVAPWRASDILAKLTDGRLREVRLTDAGRHATVVNRHGTIIRQTQLSDTDCRLLVISLQLAAVAGAAQWGLELPLVVADPFSELPAAEASILALVLHDLGRAGHQILLATAAESIVERLRSIGQPILHLEEGDCSTRISTTILEKPAASAPRTIAFSSSEPSFALQLEDEIDRFAVFGEDTGNLFGAIGIRTVSDLLDADADDVSHALDRTGISSEIVDLWQTHLAMLTYVPGLTLSDAQLLTGAEIRDLDQLATANARTLCRAIEEYLASPRGVRHRSLGHGPHVDRVAAWIAGAKQQRHRWQHSRCAARNGRSSRSIHQSQPERRNGHNGAASSKRRKKRTPQEKPRPLRFRLSRTSPVVDAPSVGPKTAKRLAKQGITTVADLLAADAEATAQALNVGHITAEKIVAWQHQSQLMCRVPELLARDAQVLVGCGFTTPEDIASAEAADLLEFAKSYTSTPAGTRALRGGDAPDLARVSMWIYWAGHRRAMEAA